MIPSLFTQILNLFKVSQKLKPLGLGPYKILKHLSDVTYELMSPDSSTFQTQRKHILPNYPKEPVIFQSFPDHFQTQTSTEDVSHDSTPKYQNLSHSPSLNDILDNTFDSTFSDFEMLPNPIYFSNSSDNSFPQIYPFSQHIYDTNFSTCYKLNSKKAVGTDKKI